MKRNRLILMCLLGFVICFAGCESLEKWSEHYTPKTQETIDTVGSVAAPFTGGISSLVAGVIGAVVPSIFAVNRQILKWKADKAAAEAQANTNNIVQAIDAAKGVGATNNVVDFNDPKTLSIINAFMTESAKSAVDSAQGKAA
ncbi:MAG: hypothetical protein ACF8OB_02950 [Phycisphaeraceae bacterium JB051]